MIRLFFVVCAISAISTYSLLQPKTTFYPKHQASIRDTNTHSMAQLLAGMPISAGGWELVGKESVVKKHYAEFEKGWKNLTDKRLDKMRLWQKQELAEWRTNTYNLFYPFSGPDFLNAFELFPNADNYVLFGLEQVGSLPTREQMKGWYLDSYLTGVRQGLSEIFSRNYFITSRMSGALNAQVKGVLPIMAVFLARTGNEILNIQKVYLQKDGRTLDRPLTDSKENLFAGVHIIFKNLSREITQHIYYFGTDVSDAPLTYRTELLKFIKDMPQKVTLVKSASYLLHTESFTTIRKLITEESIAVLQDDTGVPYKYFLPTTWDLQLYGKYAKPIADFNYGYQPDLQAKFTKDAAQVKAINFTFGYHWWTDNSSILYFKRK